MPKKRPRAIPTANLPDARKLFDGMPNPTPAQDDLAYLMISWRTSSTRAVAKPSIPWTAVKSSTIFRVPKISFFVKDLQYICCKIEPNQFSKILGHV
jgi:hypothetical protein